MRTETRTLRPFLGLQQAALDDWCQEIGIRFDDQEEFVNAPSVGCNRDVGATRPTIRLPDAEPPIMPLGLHEVTLLATFTDRSKELAVNVLRADLHQVAERAVFQLEVSNKGLRWKAGPGATIDVVLVLNRAIEPRLGLPFRKGHVLAAHTFHVNCAGPGADYPASFVDEEQGLNAGLPAGWAFYVPSGEDAMSESDEDAQLPAVLINKRFEAVLSAPKTNKEAVKAQQWLECAIVAEMLRFAAADERSVGSIGAGFLEKVGKRLNMTPAAVVDAAKRHPHCFAEAITRVAPV